MTNTKTVKRGPRDDAAHRIERALDSFGRLYPHVFSPEGFEHYSSALASIRAALKDIK